LRLLDDHYVGPLFVSSERGRATGDAVSDDKHVDHFVLICCHWLPWCDFLSKDISVSDLTLAIEGTTTDDSSAEIAEQSLPTPERFVDLRYLHAAGIR
jgi:hypothetical protein